MGLFVDNKVVLYFHCAQQGRKIETRTGKTNSRIFFVESLCHLRYNKNNRHSDEHG